MPVVEEKGQYEKRKIVASSVLGSVLGITLAVASSFISDLSIKRFLRSEWFDIVGYTINTAYLIEVGKRFAEIPAGILSYFLDCLEVVIVIGFLYYRRSVSPILTAAIFLFVTTVNIVVKSMKVYTDCYIVDAAEYADSWDCSCSISKLSSVIILSPVVVVGLIFLRTAKSSASQELPERTKISNYYDASLCSRGMHSRSQTHEAASPRV
jgi:hypothetical protein